MIYPFDCWYFLFFLSHEAVDFLFCLISEQVTRNRFGSLVDDSGFPLADRDGSTPLLTNPDTTGAAALTSGDDLQGYMRITDGLDQKKEKRSKPLLPGWGKKRSRHREG